MRTSQPRLFVFGIDGADWHIIDAMVARGRLPNLARFRREAAHAALACTQPAHTAPGWASMMTGRYPGGHGAFQFFHVQDPGYRARVTSSRDVGASTLFDWLARQGWRCGQVNVPMSHPPRKLPGYQITWPLENTLRFCDPPALLGELATAGCHFASDLACMYRGELSYIGDALRNIEQRTAAVRYLLANHPVDALAVVLTETDRVCHHYWHFSDPTHPAYEAGAPEAYRTAIDACYDAVDAAFGELLAAIPDDATVVVASDHGSGAGYDDLSLNRVLAEAGWLALRDRTAAAGAAPGDAPGDAMASWFHDDRVEVDWAGTRAYSPVPGSFGINLNLEGRQRLGTVAPGAATGLLVDIAAHCRSLISPRSGRPVFREVVRGDELYPGPFVRLAPDLMLIPEDETTILSAHVAGPMWRPSAQTGLHRFHGMWMQRSPATRAGALGTAMRIVDVAPTALADVGALWPEDITGTARHDALTRGASLGAAALYDEPETADGPGAPEDPVVSERLRAMGYL